MQCNPPVGHAALNVLNINSVENIWIQIETSDNKKPITIGVVYPTLNNLNLLVKQWKNYFLSSVVIIRNFI